MKKSIFIAMISLLLFACGKTTKQDNNSFPEKLVGVIMDYQYTGGNGYSVKFEEKGLSYQYRTGSKPETWWGTFDYNHMMTANNEHFVSWFEPGYGDYVTLLINFEDNTIYGSAIIKGKHVHFQKATLSKVTAP